MGLSDQDRRVWKRGEKESKTGHSRISAKGGIDYEETFAPVVRLESLRILLTLKAIKGWKSFHLDVILYGTIDEDIYMD